MPGEPGQGHRPLAHTADVGFEAWAPGLEQLFDEVSADKAGRARYEDLHELGFPIDGLSDVHHRKA